MRSALRLSVALALSFTAATAATASFTTPASAETIVPTVAGDRLRYDLAIDLPITFIGGSLWLGSQLMQPQVAPPECRWCDRNSDGTDGLNAFDKGARAAFRWENTKAADTASNVLGYGLSPAAALGLSAIAAGIDHRLDETPANALLVMEASFAAATLTQFVKFAVGRERPFVHALAPEDKKKTEKPSDNNVSFFSGHSNFAFALAVSSGTIASLRGYRYAPLVWATGVPLAASIAYLRVAADKHYMSDVLLGSAVGALAGFGVPFFFHRGTPAAGAASPGAAGGASAKSGKNAKGAKNGAGGAGGVGGTSAEGAERWIPSGFEASGTSFSIAWQW